MLSTVRTSKDPRTIRTRSLIVNAFLTLLHDKGFESVTVQDITDRATINRATFYAHFDDKYALFAYATREQFRETAKKYVTFDLPYSRLQLLHLIESLCDFITELQRFCSQSFRAFEPMVANEVVAEIEIILKTWMALGKTSDCDSSDWSLTTSIASWGMYGVVRDWVLHHQPEPTQQFTRRVMTYIAPIVEAPK